MGTTGRNGTRILVVLGVVTPVVLAACGADARGAGDAVVRDSAGITIVENQPDADVPAWTVAPEPILEIGGDIGDPSQELFRVRAARRLPDGGVVIANGGTQEIRFYGPDGAFLRSVGGEGEGPGEYQGLSVVERLGADSLLTFDFQNRRVSILDISGEHARSFILELSGEGFPGLEGVGGADGRALVVQEGTVFRAGQVESGVSRDSVSYHLVDATGELRGPLGRFPGSERWVLSTENMIMVRGLPFGHGPRFVATSSGFYYASTDTYDIGYYGLDGRLERRIRLLRPPRPVTDADREANRAAELAEADEERRPEIERRLRETPYPETMPAHDALHVDALGHLWVQEYTPPFEEGGTDRWRIYDPEGRQVATAELASGAVIYEIGEDYVLGRWQDELDLEYVRMYRLERNGEGS